MMYLAIMGSIEIRYTSMRLVTNATCYGLICVSVRITYNKDSNVIIMGTGSASQMRGSELCRHKKLSPGYRSMDLSRNSVC